MNKHEVQERIAELSRIRKEAGSDEAALAEAALFIEDVFGLVLTDQEICAEQIGSFESMEYFVKSKLGLTD